MSLPDLTQELLTHGRIVFTGPPEEGRAAAEETAAILDQAYQTHRLGVAGPVLPLDRGIALAAARFVARAAWLLVSRSDNDADVDRLLWLPRPKTASQHLSGDLLLRYVPHIYKRAHRLNPADVLVRRLDDVLRRWPLSGVLAPLSEPPLTELTFQGHRGLLMLYAERLADNFKAAWLPRGEAAAYVELVWSELGRDTAALGLTERT